MNIFPPSLKLRRTGNKQILSIVILCFTFTCVQSAHAMHGNLKSLIQARKTQYDLKKLQRIWDSLYTIAPKGCFTSGCENQGSCCLLARNDAEKAKEGKAIRLKQTLRSINNFVYIDDVYINNLRMIKEYLSMLQQKNVEAHNILLESQNKEEIEPLHKQLCEFTKNVSECLTYSANIFGITFYEASARYYEKNPRGLFDSTQHMTPQEREREDLQDECNKINKALMKSNGYPLNTNILLGWEAHTMDLAYTGAFLGGLKSALEGYDRYRKDGGSVD